MSFDGHHMLCPPEDLPSPPTSGTESDFYDRHLPLGDTQDRRRCITSPVKSEAGSADDGSTIVGVWETCSGEVPRSHAPQGRPPTSLLPRQPYSSLVALCNTGTTTGHHAWLLSLEPATPSLTNGSDHQPPPLLQFLIFECL